MRITIDLVANTGSFNTDILRSARNLDRQFKQAETSARRSAAAVNEQARIAVADALKAQQQTGLITGLVSRNIASLASSIGGALGVSSFVRLADEITQIDGRLRLVTNSAQEFATAQSELFRISQQNNAAFGDTAQLYTRLAASAGDLGASQGDLLQFVQGITSALRLTGTTGAQASGALLQLSQSLAAGTVRAEEFNSVNEGAPEILRVVAQNISGVDGNLGKLRQRVLDGDLTSREFFQAFLRGTDELNARAATIPTTVGGALNNLSNVLLKTVGDIDKSTGITREFAQAITELAQSVSSGALSSAITAVGQAFGFLVNNIAPIVTFFVGRTALPALFTGLSAAAATLVGSIRLLGPVLGTAAAGALALQTALSPLAFLVSPGGLLVTGLAALAAGLVFVATREKDSERTTRELTDAKDGLRKASEENAAAALDEAFAKRQVALAELQLLENAAKQQPFIVGVGRRKEIEAARQELDALEVAITEFQRRTSGEFVAPSLIRGDIVIDPEQAKEAAKLLEDVKTAAEKYGDIQNKVRALVAGGALTQDEANKILADAEKRLLYVSKAAKTIEPAIAQFEDWRRGIVDARASLTDLNTSLRDQTNLIGLTDTQALAYRLTLGDLSDEVATLGAEGQTLAASLLSQQAAYESATAAAERLAEGQRIIAENRTPIEAYNAELEKLTRLLREGAIDPETYSRAIDKARESIAETIPQVQETSTLVIEAFSQAARNIQSLLADSLVNGFQGGLRGALASLTQFLAQAAAQVASSALIKGIQGFFSEGGGGAGIGASVASFFGGFFADGGRPPLNKVSIVGERGPELFVPDTAGTIIPNSAMMPRMQMASAGAAAPVNLRIENRFDDGFIFDAQESPRGEKTYRNIARKNNLRSGPSRTTR